MPPIFHSPRIRRAALLYAAILAFGGLAGTLGGMGVFAAAAALR